MEGKFKKFNFIQLEIFCDKWESENFLLIKRRELKETVFLFMKIIFGRIVKSCTQYGLPLWKEAHSER
jgi:hypothetical protein